MASVQLPNINLAFYSAFYGTRHNAAYRIPPLPKGGASYHFYFISNNTVLLGEVRGMGWIPIYDDKSMSEDEIESCMSGKFPKVLPFQYECLQPYEYLCWLDSKLECIDANFVETMIQRHFQSGSYSLILRKHWFIQTLRGEFDASMHQHRYLRQKEQILKYIQRQLEEGLSENVETHCACGFLIWNARSLKSRDISNTWMEHILMCGIQDQISFFFVQQLFPGSILAFDDDPFR